MVTELTIKRTFDAPRELVFKAWTDPELISKWWGPRGFTTPISKVEPRQGGKFYFAMHGPKGSEFDIDLPMRGVYKEFDPPRHLFFTNDGIIDEKDVPQLSTTCDVTFTESQGITEMTVHIVLVKLNPSAEASWAGAEMGWNQMLDKLTEFLAISVTQSRM